MIEFAVICKGTLFSFNMNPSINICTRIAKTSAMLIDNIFVNFNYKESCVIPNDVSDHSGIMTVFEVNGFICRSLRIHNERFYICKASLGFLKKRLENFDWSFLSSYYVRLLKSYIISIRK